MTTRQLAQHLRPRLGDRVLLQIADTIGTKRVCFPGPRTARTTIFQATLRRGAAQGWSPGRIAHELAWLGYHKSYVVQALRRLGLRRPNPRRVAAGRRSAARTR